MTATTAAATVRDGRTNALASVTGLVGATGSATEAATRIAAFSSARATKSRHGSATRMPSDGGSVTDASTSAAMAGSDATMTATATATATAAIIGAIEHRRIAISIAIMDARADSSAIAA